MEKSMSLKNLTFIFLIMGLASVILPGCIQNKPVLRVATNVWPGYEIFYLARNLGYYEEQPIRLVEVSSTSVVTRNLRNGTLEAGCLTLDEALTLIQDKIDLRIILVIDESKGGDVLMVRPGIENLKDLHGKRIGFESSTVSAVLLDAALDKADMTINEIEQVPMSVNEQYNGYMAGKFDAVATYEPVRSQLLKEGAKILYSSAEIPGRIIDVLVVRADILSTHHEELTILLKGYFRALEFLVNHSSDAAALMEKRLGSEPLTQFKGIHLPDLDENYLYLHGDSAKLYKSAQYLMELMLERKLLRQRCSFGRMAEPKFLPIQKP